MPSCRDALARAGAIVLMLAAAAAGAPAGRLVVVPESVVAADVIRVRDVAVLEGPAAEVLGEVTLGTSPAAGEMRTFDGVGVLGTLRRAGLDEGAVTYSIPPLLRVRRAAQEVSERAVRAAIERWLGETLGAGASDAVVRSVEMPGPIRVPPGTLDIRVSAPKAAPLVGRVHLQAELVVDDRPVRRVWVATEVARFGGVVLARRAIARGETIGPGDVAVDRRDLATLPRDVVTDPGEAIGAVARTSLLPWAPVRREHLGTSTTVKRGAAVQLVAARGGLRITAAGEAKQDAARGEQVRVVNRASRKELVGRVVDDQTVAVDF